MNTFKGVQEFTMIVHNDDETGENGLLFKDCPIISYPMVATEGLLVAHDVLEHVNGVSKIGSLDDELEALGAIWFIRGQQGRLRQDGVGSRFTPQENLASDVLNMATIYNNGVNFKTEIPDLDTNHEMYDTFYEIAYLGYKSVKGEIELEDRNLNRLKVYIRASIAYMINGYDKAIERYKNTSDYAMYSLFFEIANTVDALIKDADLIEGSEYKLTIDMDNLEVEFNPMSEDSYMNIEIELGGNIEQIIIMYHNDESFSDLDLEELTEYLIDNNLEEYDSGMERLINDIESAFEDKEDISRVLPYSDTDQDFTLTISFESADY